MRKKWIALLLALSFVFGFAACKNSSDGNDSTNVYFLTLQEAFEKGEVSRADLMQMSDLVNENKFLSLDGLEEDVIGKIKKAYGDLQEIEVENVELEYYGEYNGNYAILIWDREMGFDAVITEVRIGDILFCYPVGGLEITICQFNS